MTRLKPLKFASLIILSFVISHLLSTTSYAQSEQDSVLTAPNVDLLGKYTHLSIAIGQRPVSTQANNIMLRYQDESPTTDYFSADRNVEETDNNIGLDVLITSGTFTGYHFELGLGGSFGTAGRFYGQTGLGFNFPFWQQRILLRPVANIAYGTTRFDLGDMRNTSVYIQVNDTQFYSETVDVNVSSKQLATQPRIDLLAKLSKKLWLKAALGYHLTLSHFKPFIKFSGYSQEDDLVNDREALTDDNVFLRMNDSEVKRLPVDLDGIFYSAGLVWEMGK